ncbi:MAG: cytochrome c-type biogenesis protein CcmH [Gemmatimonadaceae bacterium]|nr:cytochrome c-type biogenesis protein CcmH [Gemmatimonadaceae bacterium]
MRARLWFVAAAWGGALFSGAVRPIAAQQTTAGAALADSGIVGERSAPVSNDPVLEEKTRQVASELRCPVCQGNSIQDSPSELAQEMKGVVRDQLASGKSPDEVKAYFVAKYGEWILLEPKASGFNLVAYLLPVVMVAAGGLVIWRAVTKWTNAAKSGDESSPE